MLEINQEKRIHEQLRQKVATLIKDDINFGTNKCDLAKKLNINRSGLDNVLNNNDKVSITYLIRILTIYGCTINVSLEFSEKDIKERALRKLNKTEKQLLNIKE